MFGRIENGIMVVNEYGEIVRDEWAKTVMVQPSVVLDEFVVMTDHVHGIVWLTNVPAKTGSTGMA